MSLRARILALFLGLGVVPILLLGIIGFARSMRAVRGLLEDQTSTIARQVASDLTDRLELRLSELLLLAENAETQRLYRVFSDPASPPPDSVLLPAQEYLSRAWAQFGNSYRGIEFRDVEDRPLFSLGLPATPWAGGSTVSGGPTGGAETFQLKRGTTQPGGGEPPRPSQTALLRVPVQDLETGEKTGGIVADVLLRAVLPVEALEATFGHSGSTVVLDRREGEILHHPSRRFVNQPLSSLFGPGARNLDDQVFSGDEGSFSFRESDSSRVASFVSLRDPPWTVISTVAMDEFASPFRGARRGDLVIVLFLAAIVGGTFIVTTRRVTASLEALTEASERVGRGDLAPPLPPAGPDEVGRLSAAFALMVGQVREMLRRVEETRQMAVMGELASNISHRIRNPLTSIKLNLQGLEEEAEAEGMSATSTRSLEICLREVGHLEEAVRKILDLARTHPPQRVGTSLHGVISESVELLQSQLDARGVRVDMRLDAGEDRVLADPQELKNVFVNLLVNAEDAMPEGGTVHLSTENPGEVKDAGAGGADAGTTIRVRIRDEGPGVSEEVREQIFRPFVTTKPDGTGFGLAVTRLAVQEHLGTVYLESTASMESQRGLARGGDGVEAPSRGATFVVELPLAPASPSPAEEDPGAGPPSPVSTVNQEQEAS